ncbi:MAG: OmpA family protein [Syntrophales bacterium]|jgi:outer membrane protein OmpA-like peptidoglycan-associated protein|nr:OmpA family protein [Syntrophales bacterium]
MKRILCLVLIGMLASLHTAAAQTAADPWIERGDALEEQGIYAEAVKAYTKAIEIDPGSADAYLKRGVARFSAKKTDCAEALGDLTEAIRLTPENGEAYYQRGIVNYYLINNEQARKDMETAVALGHTGAREWLGEKVDRGTDAADNTALQTRPAVYFDHDRAAIKESYRTLLESIGAEMARKPQPSVVVSGHADSTGTREYNQALSLRRATAVKEYLVKYLVPSQRIAVMAYGEDMPVASNSTEEGRASNRRVEIADGKIPTDRP